MSVLAVLLEVAACVGLGAALLKGLGLLDRLEAAERPAWSFGLGLGALGWLIFFPAWAGWVSPLALGGVEIVAMPGCLLLGRLRLPRCGGLGIWGWAVVAALAVALVFDLAEAVSPPADADSLAYHFARPKEILLSGRLLPVARAVDGATPMLIQMTYLPALALGGERGLTLWAGISGWLALLPLFVMARRWLQPSWALALVVVVATVPAWIYGAGSGQVEARLAPFALLALVATAQALRGRDWRWAVAAGLLAGFYAGSKFFGLALVGLCGFAMLTTLRWRLVVGIGLAALVAGGQWYLWHWAKLGDPIFPMLWNWMPAGSMPLWDQAHADTLRDTYFGSETAVPTGLRWLLAYPWVASIQPFPIWEAGRTGLGALGLLTAPFALAGLWRFRAAARTSPLALMALLALLFYALWFLSGTSQRIRHLLPIYPVVALILVVAAHHWARATGRLRPLAVGMTAVIVLQLAGHSLFALGYMRGLARGEDREAFFERTVINYTPVPWINRNLRATDKLLLGERQLIYLTEVAVYFGHDVFQAEIDLLPDSPATAAEHMAQLKRQGITHVLIEPGLAVEDRSTGLWRLARQLVAAGCAKPLREFHGKLFTSRTLGLGATPSSLDLVELGPECRGRGQ